MLKLQRRMRSHARVIVGATMLLGSLLVPASRGWAQFIPRLVPDAKADTSSAEKATLPPKEAAKACLATADEMVKAGHRREAIALYARARELDPKHSQVCRILAVLCDQERMDKEALAEYILAVEQAPRDADLLNDLGYFYYMRHDLTNAELWLRKAVAESPEHERAWTNLGLTLGAAGKFQESFDAFAKVQNAASAHSNVGMMLAKNGRIAEAHRAFQNALNIDPDLRQARAGLAALDRHAAPMAPLGPRSPSAPARLARQ